MGCGKARQAAMQEFQDIYEILKLENSKLEETKEALLSDQIDKPSDDKMIEKSMRDMTRELEEKYREAHALLQNFLETIQHQQEKNPLNRIFQISELRLKLEDTYRRIENCYAQKQTYWKLNSDIRVAIDQVDIEIQAKQAELKTHKDLCLELNL